MMINVGSKLYLAGEYSVLEPGYTAIIQPLNIGMSAEINQIEQGFKVYSDMFARSIYWNAETNLEKFAQTELDFKIMLYAIITVQKFFTEQKIHLKPFDCIIQSKLYNPQKIKYGLGSSGAVIVLTIKAILTLHQIKFSDELLFKLSAITLLNLNSNGSMGDVACIAYNKTIAYSSFDRDKVRAYLATHSILESLNYRWPHLLIKPVATKLAYKIYVGWTQKPACSELLVRKFILNRQQEFYNDFLNKSQNCIKTFIQGMQNSNKDLLKEAIQTNRKLLQKFASDTNIEIETDPIQNVLDILEDKQIVAKTSGAGGGDCIIAFAFNQDEMDIISKVWQDNHILLLKEIQSES